MQSYITATYLLRLGGLQAGDYSEAFAKNPPNAIFSSYFKQSDAGGAGDKVLKLAIVKNKIDINKMKYLAVGEQLAHLPWAVKNNMEQKLVNDIQRILSQLHISDQGRKILSKARLTGLDLAQDADYDQHREIIKSVYPNLEF